MSRFWADLKRFWANLEKLEISENQGGTLVNFSKREDFRGWIFQRGDPWFSEISNVSKLAENQFLGAVGVGDHESVISLQFQTLSQPLSLRLHNHASYTTTHTIYKVDSLVFRQVRIWARRQEFRPRNCGNGPTLAAYRAVGNWVYMLGMPSDDASKPPRSADISCSTVGHAVL